MNYTGYRKMVDIIVSRHSLPSRFEIDEFPFEDEEYKNLIEIFLKFAQTNLERSCGIVGKRAFIYIVEDFSVNGFAGRIDNRGVMGIYAGSLISLYNKIVKNNPNHGEIEFLTYQSVVLWLFYHEKAHLIQKNNGMLWDFQEMTSNSTYVELKHLKEFDADIYATTLILPHIQNICKERKIQLHELVASVVAGLYILCMDFMGGSNSFYLKSNSHPHGVLRIVYIFTKLLQNLDQGELINLQNHNIGQLWQVKLYNILGISQIQFTNNMAPFNVHRTSMEQYIMELDSLQQSYLSAACNIDPKLSVKASKRSKIHAIVVDWLNEKFCTRI